MRDKFYHTISASDSDYTDLIMPDQAKRVVKSNYLHFLHWTPNYKL